MPPPMPNPLKRMTANPARPVARYRPGKAIPGQDSSDEDEEEEESQKSQPRRSQPNKSAARLQARSQELEEDDEEGFVTDEEDDDTDGGVPVAQKAAGVASISTKPLLPSQKQEDAESEEEDSESDEGEDSSEEESSSDDEPQRKYQRPTFVKKSDRNAFTSTPTPQQLVDTPEPHKELDETTRRLETTERLIADRISRDTLARLAGKKSWDDDEEIAPEDQVDDTDGIDLEAEHNAWKLRELKRLKRDREKIESDERERDEKERRQNLTESERAAEDAEYLAKQKEEKESGRGQTAYLARYHHKGAFFQDDEAAAILAKRDIMGAKFEDQVDKERLPEYMRIRDMTKLGKKGRTRYTDLKGQDTGAFGRDVMRWRPGDRERDGGVGVWGVDERFMPDEDGGRRSGPTGANASAVGQRRERARSRSPKRGGDGGDSYRPRRRSYSRSQSQSPPRRKRSLSPYHDRDKRRRVEAV